MVTIPLITLIWIQMLMAYLMRLKLEATQVILRILTVTTSLIFAKKILMVTAFLIR